MRLFPSPFRDKLNSPATVALTRVLVSSMGLLSAPIVARALGPDGRGATATAIALLGLAPVVFGLGVPLAVRRSGARGANLVGASRSSTRLLAMSTPLAFIVAPFAVNAVFSTQTETSQLSLMLGLGLAPLMAIWVSDANLLLSHERYLTFSILSLTPTLIYLCGLALLIGLDRLSIASLVATVWTGHMIASLISRRLLAIRSQQDGFLIGIRDLACMSVPNMPGQIAEGLRFRVDQILILPLAGSFTAGIYSIAGTLMLIPLAAAQAYGSAIFPNIARSTPSESSLLVAPAVRQALALGCMGMVILFILIPLGIPLLFGSAFEAAIAPSLVAATGVPALVSGYVACLCLNAQGMGTRASMALMGGLVAVTVAIFPLVSSFGAAGASTAAVLGHWTTLIIAGCFLRLKGRQMALGLDDFSQAISVMRGGTVPTGGKDG